MDIVLKDMNSTDYETFLESAINDYAANQVQNKTWIAKESIEKANQAFARLLTEGAKTKGQHFKNIEHRETKVGSVWFEERHPNGDKVLFINYLYISPANRKQGLAAKTIAALKNLAKSEQAQRIELHVFGFNTDAISLYLKNGFQTTNIVMRLEL
jgi:RimJ/RimL family protein N-acetyltransferase